MFQFFLNLKIHSNHTPTKINNKFTYEVVYCSSIIIATFVSSLLMNIVFPSLNKDFSRFHHAPFVIGWHAIFTD